MKHRVWPMMAVACALVLFAARGGGAGEKEKKKDKEPAGAAAKPIEIKGELAATDPPDKKIGGPSKLHKVKLQKGKTYTIDLVSEDFDAFLRLLSPGGDQLAEDDDSGGNLNSRVQFSPAQNGEYQVVATSLDQKTGNYTLTVRAAAPLVAKKIKAGDTVMDTFVGTDPNLPEIRKRGRPYTIEMKADKTYTIDLMSNQFDAFLILRDKAGKQLAFDDDGGEGLNSRLRFQCPADGSYTIVATGLGSPVGEYTLQVREE